MYWTLVGEFIGNNGFPIFVAVYLMVVLNKTIRENTAAIKDISHLVSHCKFRKE